MEARTNVRVALGYFLHLILGKIYVFSLCAVGYDENLTLYSRKVRAHSYTLLLWHLLHS